MGDAKRSVAIFSNFSDYDPVYSLIHVTEDQIKMLVKNGYGVKVIVGDTFEPQGAFKQAEILKIPNVPCHNEVKKDETFDQDVNDIATALREHLKGVDVCITQDIVYKPSELKHNFAARRVLGEFPNLKWLHWINSATPPITLNNLMGVFTDEYLNLVKQPWPNSFYVFFNDISKPLIARNFWVDESQVRIVHHPSDLDMVYGVTDNNLKRFIEKRDIYSADAICIYPIRLDRGKQVQFVIKTMAMVKELGMSVRVIVVDFHSTGGDKVAYRDELKQLGIDLKLNTEELSFTSEFTDDWELSVPGDVVLALFRMSNVFIMPSVSESYSLITQEAALTKNVIVLNQDFPPFRDIFGKDAIFRKYSSNWDVMAGFDEAMGKDDKGGDKGTDTRYGPGNVSDQEREKIFEPTYHKTTAGMIVDRLTNDIAMAMQIKIRKERSLQAIFKKELEPLIWS